MILFMGCLTHVEPHPITSHKEAYACAWHESQLWDYAEIHETVPRHKGKYSQLYEFVTSSHSHRLDNIIEFLRITLTYDSLGLSRIEGIETFNARFGLLVSTLKKKPYDPLEHRKQDFDADFHEFKVQLAELEVHVVYKS